ncbi:MAG: D-alanyl-D-alanine carboxypeptidase [Syntrophobacterales bacterium]|jgi:D-alanyl-D-alanine carboxypeptidase (penicillin-binding protein 5/6)|nr:D-alanyl-D-alanine carboxypeptidase [Syntrophobacterales bacterium]
MKKWWILILAILMCIGSTHARAAQKKHILPKQSKQSGKGVAAKKSEEPFKSFIVVESTTGAVLDGENVHARRAPASVTKIMTALVVLEKVSKGENTLADQITVTPDAARIGGSQVYLEAGEVFTLEEMMKAVMVASANDAAYAVAEHVAGSADAFVGLMNEKAKELNMADTEFHSAHGLPPSKGQKEDFTSASDLVILAREILKYPKIIEWTSIKSEGFRDGKFIMHNHNKLLTKMAGIDGLKTGFYRETGFNVVATVKKGDLRFIAVVMGSPSAPIRDNVAMEKLKKAFGQLRMLSIVKKGEFVDKEVMLLDGKQRKLKGVASANFLYPVAVDKKGTIKKEIVMADKIKGDVKEGQKIGEMIITFDNRQVGKVDVISPVHVPTANLFTRFIRRLGLNI